MSPNQAAPERKRRSIKGAPCGLVQRQAGLPAKRAGKPGQAAMRAPRIISISVSAVPRAEAAFWPVMRNSSATTRG